MKNEFKLMIIKYMVLWLLENTELPDNKFIGRALANSVSKFISCLGCRISRQPGPAKEDSAFLASIIQWQFLAISADGQEFVGILSRWSSAILADSREFISTLGRWSRVSRHMVLDFSATGQEFVSILGRLSRISRQSWPKNCQYSW